LSSGSQTHLIGSEGSEPSSDGIPLGDSCPVLGTESSERVCYLLYAEDGRTFLGGFFGEVKWLPQRPWPDGTFRPRVGAVNAAWVSMQLPRKKKVNALDSFVSWGFVCSPSRSGYISVRWALHFPSPSIALAFLVPMLRPQTRRAKAGERKRKKDQPRQHRSTPPPISWLPLLCRWSPRAAHP
jgi:hypothetical protein